MSDLENIVDYLDDLLGTDSIPDYPAAMNGLQLSNRLGKVTKVASAVDGSLPIIRKSIEEGADLLVVHHGLFWQGAQKIVGHVFSKLELAIGANLAIYSNHIPLDVHAEVGNNALLARDLGLVDCEPFFDWKGIKLGLRGSVNAQLSDLVAKLEDITGQVPVFCEGRGQDVGVVGLITGGAGSEIEQMVKLGINTFITGEGPHWSFPLAEEMGINVIYAGHYSTETFGVRELGRILAQKYELDHVFIDHPTGI